MSLREFKQYLELLKFSGQNVLFTKFNDFNIRINKSVVTDISEITDLSSQIICPVLPPELKSSNLEDSDQIGLDNLASRFANCEKCQLSKSRLKFVYGEGNHNANIMIIGEGPGADENITGRPFIGEAGKLLTKMLEAINIDRQNIYITNVLKCRPPLNRTPSAHEINCCLPYLQQQIRIVKPQVLLLLGKTAVSALLQLDNNMDDLRSKQPYQYGSASVWLTYHPSALLQNIEKKKDAWIDLQKFRDYLLNSNIK